MYVYQSVSWLTSLLKLDKYRDISSFWWHILLKIFGDIPDMFVHYFQMLTNFWYVCQSVSLLTFLLKLGQFWNISCSGWDIFQIFLGDTPGMILHDFEKIQILCMSVILLVGIPPYWNWTNVDISPVLDEISFRNFGGKFLAYFYDVSK